jgi:uncharacterized phage protein (TIGR02216 family)
MRLPAKDFWAMTPRELAFALGLLRPLPAVPARGALSALMCEFPDATAPEEGREGGSHGR